MEHISFQGVDLSELLPRIPDSVKDTLPFGLVKLDLTGKILEYNMAEGDLTGVNPEWAIGKNFFDEVALCTKTAAFYGRFVEGVKKGFINAVFDYNFDHREESTKVKVHMVTVPDHLGRKNVMILVKRANKPLVQDAISADPAIPVGYDATQDRTRPASLNTYQAPAMMPAATASNAKPAAAMPSIQDIVNAVVNLMNQNGPITDPNAAAQTVVASMYQQPVAVAAPVPAPAPPPPAPVAAPAPASAPAAKSRIEDILKF